MTLKELAHRYGVTAAAMRRHLVDLALQHNLQPTLPLPEGKRDRLPFHERVMQAICSEQKYWSVADIAVRLGMAQPGPIYIALKLLNAQGRLLIQPEGARKTYAGKRWTEANKPYCPEHHISAPAPTATNVTP